MSAVLSERFPTKSELMRVAALSVTVERLRANNRPVPQAWLAEIQHGWGVYSSLQPHEQAILSRAFEQAKLQVIEEQHAVQQDREVQEFQHKTDNLVKELTPGIAGRPGGLTLAQAAALRAGNRVKVATRKMPTGAEADARVKAHTGLNLKQYEKLLDEALVQRNMHRYGNEAQYQAWIEQKFPGRSFKEVDRVVKNWAVEGAGLELQRRAQKDVPDARELRPLDDIEKRRLDLVEAVAEHEGSDPRSVFAKDQSDRLREIAAERGDRSDDLRASIAEAFLSHGGTLEVELGTIRDDATDEIVSIEENRDE